ncbi:hypothetical protein [Chitinophaga sancti]|uniref:Uncharacterized protein n=1 Tax=Chitinophaga sancti TaxID=1004 RepID=A0A1K1LY90_9BACT|nr:hypothetical protein [Chitinophaga sancti]WQD64755.1 hypothetical protein U0033_10140 [Chitinophaga sancti]WQG89623.1 hypothetical protein SR876_32335 [Chitinophaga sancti]SFW15808.1 hypothetical protein SAMN05661012_00316 [Chitinophaga sancti]
MYRINPLMRDVLITTDEVIFHAPTKHTLDPRTIEQSIIIAEERIIRPALSDDLYYDLILQKNKTVTADNKDTLQDQVNSSLPAGSEQVILAIGDIVNAFEFLSADYLKLWKQHLWKLTAEVVMLGATPESFVQFGSAGVIHTVPAAGPMNTTGEVSPELRSVKWLMDKKMMDRIDPLTQAMHEWICRYKIQYPLYQKECGCDSKGVAYKRKSDIVLSVYDEIDNSSNCGCYED